MTVKEQIIKHLEKMSIESQVEILDFIEYIEIKKDTIQNEREDWNNLSLSHAMRDMENEPSLYSLDDIKEAIS